MRKIFKYAFIFCLLFSLSGCGNSNSLSGPNNDKNNNSNKVIITDLVLNDGDAFALTNDDKVYALGNASGYGDFGIGDVDELDTPTVVAENVKDFMDFANTYYIDNNNDLYYIGLAAIGSDNGGVITTFKKIYSDVKNISDGMPYCTALVTNAGDGYIDSAHSYGGGEYCGMDTTTNEFVFVGSDIQAMFTSSVYHGYITKSGDVYFKTNGSSEYVKLYENIGVVKKIYDTLSSNYILTEDNNLYKLEDTYDDSNRYSFTKVYDNIVDMGTNKFYLRDTDGNVYIFADNRYNYPLLTSQGNEFAKLDISGVEKIYYSDINKVRYVYQGTDGKLHLYSEVDKYELEPTVDNLQKLIDFVK